MTKNGPDPSSAVFSAPQTAPEPTRPGHKIAIVGTADTTLGMAPFADQSWEIWGLNGLHTFPACTRWDRWFELHDTKTLRALREGSHWKWLSAQPADKPIYMREAMPEIAASRSYPRDVLDRFPKYFTNTVSYMLALALAEGATQIGVWGVDMACDSEYSHQRPSCEYFLGLAMGSGVLVTLPTGCDLLRSDRLYGLEDESPWAAKIRSMLGSARRQVAQAEAEAKAAEVSREAAQAKGQQWAGAVQALEMLLRGA